MGGIDLHDMLVELYRVDIRVKRFYLCIIYHLLDMCVVNSWLLHRRHCRQLNIKKHISLIKFKSEVAHALLMSGRNKPNKRLFVPISMDDIRYDETAHWPVPTDTKQRCKY